MKIICLKKHLQEASILSEKVTGKNPTLPILSALLISTKNNKVKFSATNLEVGLEIVIPSEVKKEGKVAVPAKLFSSFISSLPDETKVNMETINNNLSLTTPNTSTTIKCYEHNDFPYLPKIKEKTSFSVSINKFLSGIKSVYYAVSLSEMKPEFNSVYIFLSKKGELTFTATDSPRLAEKKVSCSVPGNPSFLLPYRSAIEILRVFENIEGKMDIKSDENNIVLVSDYIKFTSRLVDGNFPDYKQIIPTKFVNTVVVDKNKLNKALRSAVMFSGRLSELKIKIYKNEKYIEIQTNNPDLGEHIVNIPAKIEGDDLSMVFNYHYLIDCLPSINTDKIMFRFSGEGKPLLITGLDDSSFLCLVMPIKDM